MHASIVTWRLTEAVREPEQYDAYLGRLAHANIPILRQFGLLDSIVLRLSDDTVQVVNVFEDQAGADAAWDEITNTLHPAIEGNLELIERVSARADDMPLRLDIAQPVDVPSTAGE